MLCQLMAVREASQDCAGGIKVMDAHTSRVRGSSHRGGTEMCRSTAGTVSAASSVWVRSKHPASSQALSVCPADVCCSFLLWFLVAVPWPMWDIICLRVNLQRIPAQTNSCCFVCYIKWTTKNLNTSTLRDFQIWCY